MVTRRFGDAGASTFRSSLVTPLFLSAALLAQAPISSPPGQAAEVAPEQSQQEPSSESQDAAPIYGKVLTADARLRCWPGEVVAPPVFEDVLKQDQVVQLGEQQNGFRCVMLPLGPIGYVSKRFAAMADDGTVTTSGAKVAFRYRPRTSEAPVDQLVKGTKVHVIGEREDWFQVRVAGIKAWIANAEVEEVPSDAANVAAYEAFVAETNKQPQGRLDAIAAAAKQRELERVEMEAVTGVESAFAAEMQKPTGQQRFAPLMTALSRVESGLQEKGAARTAAASLRKRMETQQWVNEATQIAQEEPPKGAPSARGETPKDRLGRFEAIGWLRYQSQLAQPGYYYLEKGGRRQFRLSCNTGRFDLALFVDREVGVIGPRRSPLGEVMSTLDVERIEVLGSNR